MKVRIDLFLSAVLIVLFAGCTADGPDPGVIEDYHPEKKIVFPHAKHTGINCSYCHNAVKKSRTQSLPTADVCRNCHKSISGKTPVK